MERVLQFNDLGSQWREISEVTLPKLDQLLTSGAYILGEVVQEFERDFSSYCSSRYAIGVSNGTDGLTIALRALRSSPDPMLVIMPANTFLAAPLSVVTESPLNEIHLVDIDEFFLMDVDALEDFLHSAIVRRQQIVVIATHLYGQQMDMKRVAKVCSKFGAKVIEDASQAHGSLGNAEHVGTHSDIAVYSMYPGKGLGAVGDAGLITTSDQRLADRIRMLRNYGSHKKYEYLESGWNHRLDSIQALVLTHKLKFLDSWNEKKATIANLYSQLLSDNPGVETPMVAPWVDKHVYHIYCVRARERQALQGYLAQKGIPTLIHYPIPIQKTKPFEHLNGAYSNPNTVRVAEDILSLPIHPFLTEDDVEYVVNSINEFYLSTF